LSRIRERSVVMKGLLEGFR